MLMNGQHVLAPKTVVGLLLGSALNASLAGGQTLPDYRPLLPAVAQKTIRVDPHTGYAVKLLKPGVYMITEGAYESMFVTTGAGVVLFDAPPVISRRQWPTPAKSRSWSSSTRTCTWITSAVRVSS